MHIATLSLLSVIAMLGACQHHPTIAYPKLPPAGDVEAGFDCSRLDDAILKSEAVRWVMREDGARLLSPGERAARTTTDVATSVAAATACVFCVFPVYLGEEGHTALDGADRRLQSLLQLKKDKQCAGRETALAGMNDLQMHHAVAQLLARESDDASRPDVGALRTERMRLLDKLRP